jgi:pimeloyl-ACP methyl ester carboxylesterase
MRRQLTVDGVRLAYDDAGDGIPLVCFHAVAHDAKDFAELRGRLATPVRLIALDFPGHGGSGADREPASAARYAQLVEGFLAALELRGCVLLGNSIGGAAALRVGASTPERVRALVICNPGGLVPVTALVKRATGFFAGIHARGAKGAWWYPTWYALYYRTVLQTRAARARRAEVVAQGRRMAPILAQAWRSFGQPDADQRALAPITKQPVLFAWAVRDRVVSLRAAEPAIATFPDARIERFDAGHSPFLETPEEFARALDGFLGSLSLLRAGEGPRG